MILLAKSESRGGLTLLEHTTHVVSVAERMAEALGFDRLRARQGAVLHDLGKAHPFFQAMLRKEMTFDDFCLAQPHRHEISSLLFLPLFDQEAWPELIEMVAAHHKSVLKDARNRGLLDLALYEFDGPEKVFERHAEDWNTWSPPAIALAQSFGVTSRETISRQEASHAFQFAYEYCQGLPKGWSTWRGLLMGADHFASGYMHEAARAAQLLYDVPDLETCYGPHSSHYPPSPLFPLSLRHEEARDERPHTLVTAPTGSGKTNFLLRRCRGRVFYTLPYQASINAMYLRIVNDLRKAGAPTDVRRLHAASRISLAEARGKENEDAMETQEDTALQEHPGAGIKVMTPHQLAGVVFGTPAHEVVALDLRGQDVVLDEVHTYGGLAQSMVLEMVRALVGLGCRVHIGTATIPDALAARLLAAMGGEGQVCRTGFDDETLRSFDRHRVIKLSGDSEAQDVLADLVARRQRVLVVANQVKRAQQWFDRVCEAFPDVEAMLIHGRFRRMDRADLENRLRDIEKTSAAQGRPCIVCATQVVEVSLDISFDAMITDAAPLDALVQRFGRINRRRTLESAGRTLKPVYVLAPPVLEKDCLPYEHAIVQASFEQLPGALHEPEGAVLEETSLIERISAVYPSVDPLPIDTHLAVQGGVYRIKKLQNRARSLLIEALQIDGETGVLASDVSAYEKASWQERPEWEIPLPQWVRARRWPRLEKGSYPLIVPDDCYDTERGFMPVYTSDEPSAAASSAGCFL